jgi:lysophospholipase L1-like esterase
MSARLGRLALACCAALVALLAAELAWRATRTTHYGPTTNPRYVLHDAGLGWRYRPGSSVRHVTTDFDVPVDVNERGFRDAPFPVSGAVTHPLVLALGDSQTFGWGVPVGQAFPARLSERLGVRVLNMSVSGYGTDQELLLWQREGRALEPDIVILTVCANDTREVYRPAMYGREKPWFVLEGAVPELRGVPVPRHRFAEWSHLLRSAWSSHLKSANPPPRADEIEPARRLQASLVRTLALDVLDTGGRLLVVVQDEPWLLERISDLHGVALLDVGPTLARAAATEPIDYAHDPHWNARGHAVVADSIATAIRASGWLP